MRVPQVSERIKEAPAQALRGVFAGIGQLLLITDKLRNKAPADVPHARTPAASETAADATASRPAGQREEAEPARATPPPAGSAATGSSATEPTAAAPAKPARAQAAKPAPTRDFDKTGNVRLIGDDAAAAPSGTTTPSSAPAAVVAESEREDSAPPVPVPVPVPVPNYDELSIASLRARLRNLDVAQVRQLADYERAHAGRADVIAMFERRIVKLEAEAGPEAGT